MSGKRAFGMRTVGLVVVVFLSGGCASKARPQDEDKFVTVRTNDGRVQVVYLSPATDPRASEIGPLAQEVLNALADYENVHLSQALSVTDHARWEFRVEPENLAVCYGEKSERVDTITFQREEITNMLTDHEKAAVAGVCKETLPLHQKLTKLNVYKKVREARAEGAAVRARFKTAKK